ncbi:MAG: ThiF family adenylyltransferase [Verrucomicrobiota bacterium]
MSRELINRSPDLKRLREDGYLIQILGGFLIMREVPYVDASGKVQSGSLISSLNLAGDVAQKPDDHTVYFDGEYPCDSNGNALSKIQNSSQNYNLGNGLTAKHRFSSKPKQGYADYYEKMATYATIIAGPAAVLQPGVTPRSSREPDEDEESVFNYVETASDRVGIGALTDRLAVDRLAIIGLGGTGSYILDLVAKTPVPEIRLFDGDDLLSHNAFRGPGAPTIEQLRESLKKVDYYSAIYSRMHRGLVAHPVFLDKNNLDLLDGITFAFLAMPGGKAKRAIIGKLEADGVSFIDVGMGLELDDNSLGGILRVTASTPEKRNHFEGRVSVDHDEGEDIYSSNIQTADLNAMNATLAVHKWKKLREFYRDLEGEHHSTYTTDGNIIINSDQKS